MFSRIMNAIRSSSGTSYGLGRWSLKHNKSFQENVTVLNANRDHCGDSVCGNPKEYNELVKKYINKKNHNVK